jgi:hypothetical protein
VVSVIAISARYRFPQYTRATFQAAAGGIQAPAWNPAYPIKDWFDPGAVAGVDSTYQVMNGSDMLPALITLTIPGAEALTVNLPGTPTFSAYVVAPTLATKQTNFARMVFAANPVDPGTLATLAQANTLAAVAGATVVDPTGPLNQFLIFSWNGETRRPYVLMPPGATGDPTVSGQNVGQILASVNAAGVAAPGHGARSGADAAQRWRDAGCVSGRHSVHAGDPRGWRDAAGRRCCRCAGGRRFRRPGPHDVDGGVRRD